MESWPVLHRAKPRLDRTSSEPPLDLPRGGELALRGPQGRTSGEPQSNSELAVERVQVCGMGFAVFCFTLSGVSRKYCEGRKEKWSEPVDLDPGSKKKLTGIKGKLPAQFILVGHFVALAWGRCGPRA